MKRSRDPEADDDYRKTEFSRHGRAGDCARELIAVVTACTRPEHVQARHDPSIG